VRHQGLRHPRDMGEREVLAFLTHLAVDRNLAAATQAQALATSVSVSARHRPPPCWAWPSAKGTRAGAIAGGTERV
jgi:hypothetical protein